MSPAGQSEESFLLENDAPTNQEGGQQGQSQTQPLVVGADCLNTCRETCSQCVYEGVYLQSLCSLTLSDLEKKKKTLRNLLNEFS